MSWREFTVTIVARGLLAAAPAVHAGLESMLTALRAGAGAGAGAAKT